MPEKLEQENPDHKLEIRPENPDLLGPWRKTFYIPMHEKLRPENPAGQQKTTGKTYRPVTIIDKASKKKDMEKGDLLMLH